MLLNEDLFDDIVDIEVPEVVEIETVEKIPEEEIVPSGPDNLEDSGVADMLLNLINDENDAILGYNSFNSTLTSMNLRADFIPVINDIIAEEMNHIGMLQTLLKKVSPNAETIHQGEAEAEEMLTESFDDELEAEDNLALQTVDESEMKEDYIPGFGEMPGSYIDPSTGTLSTYRDDDIDSFYDEEDINLAPMMNMPEVSYDDIDISTVDDDFYM